MAFRSSMAAVLFCLLAPFLLPLAGNAFAGSGPSGNPHSSFREPSRCGKCHRYEGTQIAAGRFTAESVDFCRECHVTDPRGRVHPVLGPPGVTFRDVRVPADLPLSDDGRVICLTCHNAHGSFLSAARAYRDQAPAAAARPGETPSYRTYFLRRADPSGVGFEPLCRGCHRSP